MKTKKTPSAVVISFQVVSRRDGCSKVHSQRIWHSLKISQTPGIGGGDENAKTVTFLKRSPSGAGSEEEEEERPAGDVNANRYTCSVNLPVCVFLDHLDEGRKSEGPLLAKDGQRALPIPKSRRS